MLTLIYSAELSWYSRHYLARNYDEILASSLTARHVFVTVVTRWDLSTYERSFLLSTWRSPVTAVLWQDRHLQLNPPVSRHNHRTAAPHQCSDRSRTSSHHSPTVPTQHSSISDRCAQPISQFRPFTGTSNLNHSAAWTGVPVGGGQLQGGDIKTEMARHGPVWQISTIPTRQITGCRQPRQNIERHVGRCSWANDRGSSLCGRLWNWNRWPNGFRNNLPDSSSASNKEATNSNQKSEKQQQSRQIWSSGNGSNTRDQRASKCKTPVPAEKMQLIWLTKSLMNYYHFSPRLVCYV